MSFLFHDSLTKLQSLLFSLEKLLQCASGIIFPIIKAEGVRQMFFAATLPAYYRVPLDRRPLLRRRRGDLATTKMPLICLGIGVQCSVPMMMLSVM